MTKLPDLQITIEVDTTAATAAFSEAVRQAVDAIARITPYLRRFALQQQRHRIRTVTRAKQRKAW